MARSSSDNLYWTFWWVATLTWTKHLVRTAWVVMNNFYVIPMYFVWLGVLSPLLLFDPALYWHIEDILFGWLLGMVACWNYTAGYSVVESGDRLDKVASERFLFMPNHQSTADVPLCMTIFAARPNFADRVMWIMDRVFKYSNFGCVSWMHDDFFILAGKENRDRSLVELESHLQRVFIAKKRRYIVLFPEGGFLRKRKPVSQRFAEKNKLPMLEHCTLPRTGALEVILKVLGPNAYSGNYSSSNGSNTILNSNGLRPSVNKIVDVTIAYPEGKPLDLISIATGWRPPCTTHVHYRVFDIKQLPSDTEGIKEWMYNLYVEKEQMLDEYYKTGIFPHNMFPSNLTTSDTDTSNGGGSKFDNARGPRVLHHDPLRFLLLHLFFIATFLVVLSVANYVYTAILGT